MKSYGDQDEAQASTGQGPRHHGRDDDSVDLVDCERSGWLSVKQEGSRERWSETPECWQQRTRRWRLHSGQYLDYRCKGGGKKVSS
jgi:hypothetical protein